MTRVQRSRIRKPRVEGRQQGAKRGHDLLIPAPDVNGFQARRIMKQDDQT